MPTQPHTSLISFCAKLPHATRDIKWGNHLVFSVGGKMFACFCDEGGPTLSFKASEDEFRRLTNLKGIIPAPYAARYFWVQVQSPKALPATAARVLIRESYDMVQCKLPKKVREAMAGGRAAKPGGKTNTVTRKSSKAARR